MPAKIRLARHGRKRYPYYFIVVADSRAPRDGRFIDRIGSYNPNTNPTTIELDFNRALQWVQNGAEPTDTARRLLSEAGVLHKNHLLGGVKKGAFSLEEAETRFNSWLEDKKLKTIRQREEIIGKEKSQREKSLEREKKVRQARANAIAAKNAVPVQEAGQTEESVAE